MSEPPQLLVIQDDLTEDHGWCWVFFFNSQRYLETGEFRYALAGNGPILVEKRTGEIQQIPPALCFDMKKAVAQARTKKFPSALTQAR
jgi:hypothetical protein